MTIAVIAPRSRSFVARAWSAILAAWGAFLGVLPHVLHHVGPLAGAALLAGTVRAAALRGDRARRLRSWIDGTNVAALGERELPPFRARTFGFIFQGFNLIPALSARENVEVALNIAGETGRAARERAATLLETMGLFERLDFPIDQLSGGEEQRVAVARAIANRPALILADEPTANLDRTTAPRRCASCAGSRRTRARRS